MSGGAGLNLDVGGSSTSPVSVGVGGNAGITMAPKGISPTILIAVAVAVAALVYFGAKGK